MTRMRATRMPAPAGLSRDKRTAIAVIAAAGFNAMTTACEPNDFSPRRPRTSAPPPLWRKVTLPTIILARRTSMAYAHGRTFYDADSHVMELTDFLIEHAD